MAAERASGIDVSHYKKRIDWRKVKQSGVQYAFIKATESEFFVDPRFDFNWTRTRREGLIRGAYHFFRPLVDPVAQANNFIKIAGRTLHETDLPPVLDIEMYPDFMEREWKAIKLDVRMSRIQAWLNAVESATGRVPVLYTDYYTWYELLDNTERFTRYPLWIATYGVKQPKVPANNWGGRGWWFWQTTDRGIVPGIREEAPCVDMNLFAGTFEDMTTWLKIEGPRALPPAVTNGDMMAALIDTADQLKISSDDLVARAQLRHLVEPIGNSVRPYDGPAVADLPVTEEEKMALNTFLEDYIGTNSAAWIVTHQEMINAFYYAASLDGTGGWTLVERAGLDYIGEDRDEIYDGPVIEELPNLTEEQRDAITAALGLKEEAEETPVIEAVTEPAGESTEEEIESGEESEQNETAEINATYGQEVNNQAVINAFYLTAIRLDRNGREMMEKVGLSALVNDRLSVYTGPRVEALPGLTDEERESIAGLMGIDLGDLVVDEVLPEETEVVEVETTEVEEILPLEEFLEEQTEESTSSEPTSTISVEEFLEENDVEVAGETQPEGALETSDDLPEMPQPVPEMPRPEPIVEKPEPAPVTDGPTYPGLINQDLINLFLRVAEFLGENGWHWLVETGLEFINKDRKSRFDTYQGPKIAELAFLTPEQRTALEDELAKMAR